MPQPYLTYLLGGIISDNRGIQAVLVPFLYSCSETTELEGDHKLRDNLFETLTVSLEEFESDYLPKCVVNVPDKKSIVTDFVLKQGTNEVKPVLNLGDFTKYIPFTLFVDPSGKLMALPSDLFSYCVDMGIYQIKGKHTKVQSEVFNSYRTPYKLTATQKERYKKDSNDGCIQRNNFLDFLIKLFTTVESSIYSLGQLVPYGFCDDLLTYVKKAYGSDTIKMLLTQESDLRVFSQCARTNRFICEHIKNELEPYSSYRFYDAQGEFQKQLLSHAKVTKLSERSGSDLLYYFASAISTLRIGNSEDNGLPVQLDHMNMLVKIGYGVIPLRITLNKTFWKYRVCSYVPELSDFDSRYVSLMLYGEIRGWGPQCSIRVGIRVTITETGQVSAMVVDFKKLYYDYEQAEKVHPFNYHVYSLLEDSYNHVVNLRLDSGNRTYVDPKEVQNETVKQLLSESCTEKEVRSLLSNYGIERNTKFSGLPGRVSHVITNEDFLMETRSLTEDGNTSTSDNVRHLTFYFQGLKTAEFVVNANQDKLEAVFKNMFADLKDSSYKNSVPVNRYANYDFLDGGDYLKYAYLNSPQDTAVTEAKQVSRYLCVGILRLSGESCLFYKIPGVLCDYGGILRSDDVNSSAKPYDGFYTYLPVASGPDLDDLIKLGRALNNYAPLAMVAQYMEGDKLSRAWGTAYAKTPEDKAQSIAYYLQERLFNGKTHTLTKLFPFTNGLVDGMKLPIGEED